MIISPYKTRQIFLRVAYVTSDGRYLTEYGEIRNPKRLIDNHKLKCFCTWDTAVQLANVEGRGEAMLWEGTHIRWRPFQFPTEEQWIFRGYDAIVLKTPVHDDDELNLSELIRWRDWLYDNNARPGTLGGAAKSLLKARLQKKLVCSRGWPQQRIIQSAGARIVLGPAGQGTFIGRLTHWDMPAAYAAELGGVRYGGRWISERDPTPERLDELCALGVPVFCRARVSIPPGLHHGPLVRRFPRRMTTYDLDKNERDPKGLKRYPVGTTIQGIWTWEEICSAYMVGCSVSILAAWRHNSEDRIFANWWSAVQEGRAMGTNTLAGRLAKMTGNALWGQVALVGGRKTIIHRDGRRIQRRHPKVIPVLVPATELAEIVAGRVRAKLYNAMTELGDDFLSGHTDGLWSINRSAPPAGTWQPKHAGVNRLDLYSPQHMRWYYRSGGYEVMYSGIRDKDKETAFETTWQAYLEGAK